MRGLEFRAHCFGAHTRTIQARHAVRGLKSETSLLGVHRFGRFLTSGPESLA